jgi:predicted transcriptional regulator
MTLRLTDAEQDALRQLAAAEGISMQEVVRRAVRDYVERSHHEVRVADAADRVIDAHADALDRLGK